MRFRDYALALDGGTQIIVLETGDCGQITIRLDGRMNSPTGGKQLFIGNYPEIPDTRMLPIGGIEEREVISRWRSGLSKLKASFEKKPLWIQINQH